MKYVPAGNRYDRMVYRRCGRSGVKLPALSLGLWHNFGDVDVYEDFRRILWRAFDSGITHFDLANNYGPPYGSAETNFGRILQSDFSSWRDEMLISTKAGYDMWAGPYGDWGSRKYLLSSLDQSLRRMRLDYVDIFYSHRPDPETPLEETMGALAHAVRQGKALYAAVSNYPVDLAAQAFALLRDMGTPCLLHQPKYSMLERWVESGLLALLEQSGVGCIAFSPLAQGLLTGKYIGGVPKRSRAAKAHGALRREEITEEKLGRIARLNEIAGERNQSMAQMALAWLLKDPRVTSVLIGASSVEQLDENLNALDNFSFSQEELIRIDSALR